MAIHIGGPILLIGLLSWPMLFTDYGFGEGEWVNHLWQLWDQSLSLRESHYPSFFLVTYHHSIFYPNFAFYTGTLQTILGALSLALGNAPIVAYVAGYLFSFAAAYGGWYWMAHMAGLGRWQAHAPGVVCITSTYYLTLIYERGDLPELIAVSMIPLLLASALSILRNTELRLGPAAALVVGGVIFWGSHPLTEVWGSSVIALTGVLVIVFIPQARRLVTKQGVIRVAVPLAAAALVSSWSLLPAIAYESHTFISTEYQFWRATLSHWQSMVAAPHIYTLSRSLGKKRPFELAISLPILAMAWSLVSVFVFLRRGLRGPWERLLLILAGMVALMTIVMTHTAIVLALPRPYAMLQFSYRLESYVILLTCGTVLVGLVLAQRARTRTHYWAWALIPALAIGIVGAIQQTDAYQINGNRQQALEQHVKPGPREEGALYGYIDDQLHVYAYTSKQAEAAAPEVDFPVASVHHDHTSMIVHLKPGTLVFSDIGGGPELVHVTGAKIVGLTTHQNDVLRIGPSIAKPHRSAGRHRGPRWTEVISVSTADGLPIVLGRVLSLAALAFLIGGFLLLLVRRIAQRGMGAPARRTGTRTKAPRRRTSSPGTPRSPRSRPHGRSPTP